MGWFIGISSRAALCVFLSAFADRSSRSFLSSALGGVVSHLLVPNSVSRFCDSDDRFLSEFPRSGLKLLVVVVVVLLLSDFLWPRRSGTGPCAGTGGGIGNVTGMGATGIPCAFRTIPVCGVPAGTVVGGAGAIGEGVCGGSGGGNDGKCG